MDDRDLWKAAVAEFLGPFALVVAGVGTIIATQNLGDGGNLVAVGLAHGLAIGLMVAAMGAISGGHFNPAVTISFLATGNVAPVRAGVYIVAQLLGGIAGAGVLTLIFPALGELGRNNAGVNLGVPALGPDITPLGGTLLEAIMTFFLVLVIFGTAVDSRGPKAIAPLAIGLTIAMDIFFGGRLTGAAMNPARAFGPEVIQQDFTGFWIYWVGPVVGGLVAAFLYTFLWLQPAAPTAPARVTESAVAPPAPKPVPPAQPQRRRNRR
ncbi:MAG: MIP family channel protein [Thermomicrobiales bacterium]|nr:MIP family channel protein [Thermomicrobiales bacterium]